MLMATEILIEITPETIVITAPSLEFQERLPNSLLIESMSSYKILAIGVTEKLLDVQERDRLRQRYPEHQFVPFYSADKFDWRFMIELIKMVRVLLLQSFRGNSISQLVQQFRFRCQMKMMLPDYDMVSIVQRSQFEWRVLMFPQVSSLEINGKMRFGNDQPNSNSEKKPKGIFWAHLSIGITMLGFIALSSLLLIPPVAWFDSINASFLVMMVVVLVSIVLWIFIAATCATIVWGVFAKRFWGRTFVSIFLEDYLREQKTPEFLISFIMRFLALDKGLT